jgi:cytochrome c-type biogenesis protein CcmH
MRLACFLSFLIGASLLSADELITFPNAQLEQRYHKLNNELRCPKCVNQSIADSNAGISEDLRNIVYEKLLEGKSDQEIKTFLQQRYGNFILYQPEKKGANLLLWFGPALGLMTVLIFLFARLRKKSKQAIASNTISEAEQAKLSALLDQDKS